MTDHAHLDRFTAIYHALEAERRWWKGPQRLRYAALAAVLCDGDAATVAKRMRSTAKALADRSPWHWGVNPNIQLIVAALLVERRDTAGAFLGEFKRVRKMFREVRLRRALQYELLAALILRIQTAGKPVRGPTIARFRSIYEEMQRHHRFLTGPDDFPACALLTGQPGTPRTMLEDVEATYRAMRGHGFAAGNPLQTAANIMSTAEGGPREVAGRAAALRDAFRERKVRIHQRDYDEVAILSILTLRPRDVVARVVDVETALRAVRPKIDRETRFDIAVGIAFLDLAARAATSGGLRGAAAAMNLQAVLAAQQAMLAAAAAASIAATSAASGGGGG